MYDPCDEISVGRSSREGSQQGIDSVVTWKRQAKWIVQPEIIWHAGRFSTFLEHSRLRYLMLPWDNALLEGKRLEVSEDVSLAAEVAVRKVTVIPQLFS